MRQADAGVAGVFGVLGEKEPVFGAVIQRKRGLPRLLSNKVAREDFFDSEPPVLLRLGRANSACLSVSRRVCCD